MMKNTIKMFFKKLFTRSNYNNSFVPINQPCFDKNGTQLGWFSRSMATAIFLFCKDKNGKLHVLASERGSGAADFNGLWNCPCGYLEFGVRLSENAVAECFQETGVLVKANEIEFMDFDDSLTANRQNVTFHYRFIEENKTIDDFEFSHKYMEKNEVGEIKWIPLDEIDKYQWAFGHDKLIKKYAP